MDLFTGQVSERSRFNPYGLHFQTPEELELMLESLNVVDVGLFYLGDKLRKLPISPRYVTLCPNHLEKQPSFYLHPAKNTYTCYGCQVHGGPLSLDYLLGGTIYGQIANGIGIGALLPTAYDLDFSYSHFYPQELEDKINDRQKRFIDILGAHLERDLGL